MKKIITNWKNILLLLLVIIIIIESCHIVYLRDCRHRQVLLFHKFFERQQKDFIEYNNPFETSSLVLGYLSQENLPKALAWSNLIIDTRSDDDGILCDGSWLLYMYSLRGDVYYKMGDYDKAIDDYSIAINFIEPLKKLMVKTQSRRVGKTKEVSALH